MLAATAIIGATGLGLIKEHEGLRTKAYLDPVGIPTICYGHTGPEVRMGLIYTKDQCETILIKDIAIHRRGIEKCVKAPITPNQRDAVVSFAFNVGVSRACNSTMVRHLNAGNYTAAAKEFPKWKFAGGKALPGLVKRRAAEQALFLTPYRNPSEAASLATLRAITGIPTWLY